MAPAVAIANSRLIDFADGKVSFRWKDYHHESQQKVMHLDTTEFIRRFLLHVLPRGFKRIRHYGLLSSARKKVGLVAARQALDVPPSLPAVIESVAAFMQRVGQFERCRCPRCGSGVFRVVAVIPPVRHAYPVRGPP